MYFLLGLDDETDAKAEELDKKRNALAAFCKLVVYNIFDMRSAAPVIAYFIKVRLKYTNENDPRSYEVTFKALTNKAQKKF